jgi:hypothetical protein
MVLVLSPVHQSGERGEVALFTEMLSRSLARLELFQEMPVLLVLVHHLLLITILRTDR